MTAFSVPHGLDLSCKSKRCGWRAEPGELFDPEIGCPRCALERGRIALRVARPRVPERAIQLLEHPLSRERNVLLDMTAIELVEVIETMHQARSAYSEREVLWDCLQRADRAKIKALEAELAERDKAAQAA